MEQPLISGVAHDRTRAKITVVGVPDVPGSAAKVFGLINEAKVNLDMIVQNVPTDRPGVTDISSLWIKIRAPPRWRRWKLLRLSWVSRRLFTTSRLVSCRWLARA